MRRSVVRSIVVSLTVITSLALADGLPRAAADPAAPRTSGVPHGVLLAVDGSGSADVWAVGYTYHPGSYRHGALIEHWDGSGWSVATVPATGSTELHGVAVAGPDDAWAVGGTSSGPLALHWDGAAWSVTTFPAFDRAAALLAVTVVSPHDVWAVGWRRPDGPGNRITLTAHWDGTAWSVVDSPNPGGQHFNELGVAANGADDVVAVGVKNSTFLAERWDGTGWSVERPADPPNGTADGLYAVAATPDGRFWSVGSLFDGTYGKNLAEHVVGADWEVVTCRSPIGQSTDVAGVSAVADDDVWAVGSTEPDGRARTFTTHWDGHAWAHVPSPDPRRHWRAGLSAVAMIATNDVWAVGDRIHGAHAVPFIEHFDGTAWSIVRGA